MSWLGDVLGGSASGLIDGAGKLVDRFIQTPDEKAQAKLAFEGLLQQHHAEIEATLRTRLQAKERILVAELGQDDKFTKRARPAVVYVGLVFIAINHVLAPLIASALGADPAKLALSLPAEFWAAWGGICATWVIGRSAEKRGNHGKATQVVTGLHTSLTD